MNNNDNYEKNCKNRSIYNKICLKTIQQKNTPTVMRIQTKHLTKNKKFCINQITKIIILFISVGVLQTRDINIP